MRLNPSQPCDRSCNSNQIQLASNSDSVTTDTNFFLETDFFFPLINYDTDRTMSESDPFLNDSAELGGGRAHREDVELGWRRLLVGAGRQVAEQPILIKVLLGFAPLGFIAGFLGWNAVLVSVFNFLAIIPLSALISDASDTLANRWGSLLGGLVNATFGNTVELIVSYYLN